MTMRAWRTKKNALAKVTVAQAFLPVYLIWGGDDEQSISGLACALASATVTSIQPASHRASPRIAAERGPLPPRNSPDVRWNYSVEKLGSFDYPHLQPLELFQAHLNVFGR